MENLIVSTNLEFIKQEDSLDEAFASVSLNPYFVWAQAVITDDLPNLNKKRIPVEEFDNLIKTGTFSPIKMAEGEISDGHAEAMGRPIGALTHLKKVGNQVKAIIALWKRERPEDVSALLAMKEGGQLPQLSWEIAYGESTEEDNGITALRDIVLNGVAIVGMPAYAGRTALTSFASVEETSEDKELDELELLKTQLAEKDNMIADLQSKLAAKDEELSAIKAEKDELAAFKQSIEEENAAKEKLEGIKAKFSENGIEKEAAYFDEKKEQLLKMSEDELDFLLQELVSFASTVKTETSSVKLPAFVAENKKMTGKEIAQALLKMK